MEGGSRFESYSRRATETHEQRFREELRGEVSRMLAETSGGLAYEVGVKVLEKLNIKDKLESMRMYKDDVSVYQDWKWLGLFVLIEHRSKIDWSDKKSGFEIKKGDLVLDIHLPTVPEDRKTFASVTESMEMVAKYIVQHQIPAKYVVGVTFEKLARVSERQGFTVIEPEVPDELRAGVERVFERFSDSSRRMGRVLVCFQTTEDLINRYLKN